MEGRLANRQPAEQQHVEWLALSASGGHDEMVGGTEYDELAVLDRFYLRSGAAVAGEHVAEGAEGRIPRDREIRPGARLTLALRSSKSSNGREQGGSSPCPAPGR